MKFNLLNTFNQIRWLENKEKMLIISLMIVLGQNAHHRNKIW
jgi:hypothetical protein